MIYVHEVCFTQGVATMLKFRSCFNDTYGQLCHIRKLLRAQLVRQLGSLSKPGPHCPVSSFQVGQCCSTVSRLQLDVLFLNYLIKTSFTGKHITTMSAELVNISNNLKISVFSCYFKAAGQMHVCMLMKNYRIVFNYMSNIYSSCNQSTLVGFVLYTGIYLRFKYTYSIHITWTLKHPDVPDICSI